MKQIFDCATSRRFATQRSGSFKAQRTAALHEFSRENEIETFVIKTRAKKGRMAGGAISFKIETLIQLIEEYHTKFVSPVALSHFAKKEVKEYPEKLPVYLKNAFLSGAYALTKG